MYQFLYVKLYQGITLKISLSHGEDLDPVTSGTGHMGRKINGGTWGQGVTSSRGCVVVEDRRREGVGEDVRQDQEVLVSSGTRFLTRTKIQGSVGGVYLVGFRLSRGQQMGTPMSRVVVKTPIH